MRSKQPSLATSLSGINLAARKLFSFQRAQYADDLLGYPFGAALQFFLLHFPEILLKVLMVSISNNLSPCSSIFSLIAVSHGFGGM